jgi:UDP-N-acetylglucosamine acyltransferase
MSARRIHPTAVVDPRAELADDIEIGPFAVVEAGARIGRATRVMAHVVVHGAATIGEENVVHPFAVLGGAPQAKRHKSASLRVEIGHRNVIREHVTIHGGTERATRVGDGNLLMVGCHVAHDAAMGSHVVVANGVQLAGHVEVGDYVTFGGLAAAAQFVRIGESAFVAGGAMCERDVPPFVIVQGDRARVRALNVVGLRRRGVRDESIAKLERAFRALFGGKLSRAEALRAIERDDPFVAALASALETTTRAFR